jgi:hypothetical protein
MMPYVPKFKHLFKILFRRRDPAAAEGLYFEGTWLHDTGDEQGARMAFNHARLLDPAFGGAWYNYAALTEKLTGAGKETIKAWEAYVLSAEKDPRQNRETIEKVRQHIRELRGKGKQ